MPSIRIYNDYGVTPYYWNVTETLYNKIKECAEELWSLRNQHDIDPRDFKTYCEDTLNGLLAEKMVRGGVEKRKRDLEQNPHIQPTEKMQP